MNKKTCETCAWWVQQPPEQWGPPMGQCRRRSPVTYGGEQYAFEGWPKTKTNDFCGEHTTGSSEDG